MARWHDLSDFVWESWVSWAFRVDSCCIPNFLNGSFWFCILLQVLYLRLMASKRKRKSEVGQLGLIGHWCADLDSVALEVGLFSTSALSLRVSAAESEWGRRM
jgi:hypothetical protein